MHSNQNNKDGKRQPIQFMSHNLVNIMIKVKCYYFDLNLDYRYCSFVDEKNIELVSFGNIFSYLSISMTSDIYLPERIEEHWKIIDMVSKDETAIEFGGGQQFELEFHENMVRFYHNEFDEEDGFPVLSCPLSVFKTVLTAWDAFLRLPKNIHSIVETEIPEWEYE